MISFGNESCAKGSDRGEPTSESRGPCSRTLDFQFHWLGGEFPEALIWEWPNVGFPNDFAWERGKRGVPR